MYLTEISPVRLRGAIGTIYQLVITISILISSVLGLKSLLGTDDRWPILFGKNLFKNLYKNFLSFYFLFFFSSNGHSSNIHGTINAVLPRVAQTSFNQSRKRSSSAKRFHYL